MPDNTLRREKEQQLAKSLQKGDQEALSIIYDTYAPVLLGLISKLIRQPEIAEAVLADTFLAIWKKRNAYDPEKTGFLTWLIMIAKDTAVKALAAGKFQHFPKAEEMLTFAGPETTKAESFAENRLKTALCQLEPNEQAALDLIYLKGYSVAEAAAALNMPVAAIITSLKKAIKRIGAESAL